MTNRLLLFAKALSGISYVEWVGLKHAIDQFFSLKKSELERTLQLADQNEAEAAILQQFGQIRD